MTFDKLMLEIPGQDAALILTAVLALLSALWTARFNRTFLGGRFLVNQHWMPTVFQRFPRILRMLGCWWIIFFSSPAILIIALLSLPFGIRVFPVFIPRWIKTAAPAKSFSAWAEINFAKIPIGALFVIIDVGMCKLTFSAIFDESVVYWGLLTVFWLVITLSAARIGLRHFFQNPATYLGINYDAHKPD